MLHVYQRVESIHETQTGFFFFLKKIFIDIISIFIFCNAFIQ